MDFFDRMINRMLSGDKKRRIRQVAISAIILSILCVAILLVMALYPIEMKIFAEGRFLRTAEPNELVLDLSVKGDYYELLEPGLHVRLEGLKSLDFRVVKLSAISDGKFNVRAKAQVNASAVRDIDTKQMYKARIIYRKESLLAVLLNS